MMIRKDEAAELDLRTYITPKASSTLAHSPNGSLDVAHGGRAILFSIFEYGTLRISMNEHSGQQWDPVSEALLLQQCAELNQIYENSPVGLAVIDRDMRITRINERMVEMVGKPGEEHIGRTLDEVVPDLAEYLKSIFLPILGNGEPVLDVEISGTTPKAPGVKRHWLASYYPLKSDDGEVVGVLSAVTEISERNRVEESLRLTQFAVDHASDAIFWIDENARFVYVNDAACQSLGYSREELLQMGVGDIDPVFPMDQWQEIWGENKAQGSSTFESLHKTKQGRVFPVEVRVNFIEYGGSSLDCAYVRDISERKRAEEALRESSQMLRSVLDTIPVSVWWKDRNGVYLGSNYRNVVNAGLASPEEMIGKTDLDMPWKYDEAERYRADDQEVMKTGVPKLNYEETQRTAEGHTAWIRTSKVPLRNADGDIIGVLGTFEDITEHKESEEALRQSEAFLDSIIEYSPISMWISDDKGTFIRQNQACRDLFHTSDVDVIGRYNVLQDSNIEEQGFGPLIRRVFEKGETVRFNLWYDTSRLTFVRLDEPVLVYLDVTISPVLDASGRVTNAIGQQVDITERKQVEDALHKANRTLAALSRVNEILVRATEEPELLRDVCQAVVEVGGYRMAWVGFAENDEEKTVRPVAHAGYENGYLDQIKISWGDNELGQGPTGTAIRTGRLSVVNDVHQEPSYVPWREEATKRGYGCSISLPLTTNGDAIGAISLYRTDPGLLDPAEEKLLSQLASDLSYGITSLRARKERKAAEIERRALEQRLDEHKRKFYRETILSVTDGKLNICETAAMKPYILNAQMKTDVRQAAEVGQARREVEAFCSSHGLSGEKLSEFIVGVGEAITNALKHGYWGCVYAGKTDDEIWVGVKDWGPGIESLILPRAVLLRGFSTKPSMGLGYSIMLDVADHILLNTGSHGTTIVLIKSLLESAPVSLDTIPDTWKGIPDTVM